MGNVIVYNISENDKLIFSTEEESTIKATVVEKRGQAIEQNDEVEVVCAEENNTVVLYAHVMGVGELSSEFDVYALRLTEDDTEDLGEITEINIQ